MPLLLGVGVAFKIYYIMAWRDGVTHLLQTSLTRAVIYSAMTTAVAFGSLMFSSHPGTASMGRLLALSLVTTLCAAVLFQPILMGKPQQSRSRGRISGSLQGISDNANFQGAGASDGDGVGAGIGASRRHEGGADRLPAGRAPAMRQDRRRATIRNTATVCSRISKNCRKSANKC